MSNVIQRTLSGTLYVVVVVASILVHPIFFGVLFAIISMMAVREFHQLMNSSVFSTVMAMIAAALLFVSSWMLGYFLDSGEQAAGIAGMSLFYGILVMAALLAELWLKAENPVQNWGNFLQSQIMIAIPFTLMNFLYFADPYLLLSVFVLIWVNDTGAYCVGSLTAKRPNGNHKMFPRISPKKSWEGLIGGIVFAIAAGALLTCLGWFDELYSEQAYIQGMCFAFLIAVFGTLGDLMESLFKRTIGVKDSGNFLPGHGGVLDRFDSILLAVPASLLFMAFIAAI